MNSIGGADRDRTDDLLNANQALFQLSYGPKIATKVKSIEQDCNKEQMFFKNYFV